MKIEKALLVDWPRHLDINRINEEFGSPAWIVSENQLETNVIEYTKFTGDSCRIFYPVKTNPSLTVLQILAKLDCGADCASQLEINLALLAGIKPENISYNSPVQDVKICRSLLASGASVVMDDIDAIIELQDVLKDVEINGKVFLRLNLPDYIGYSNKNDNQELMAHGHQSSKFGIPTEDVEGVLKRITLPISGLHVHVGTQMDNMKSFEHAITVLHDFAHRLKQLRHNITDINLGGGLGIPFAENQEFPALDYWCETMNQLKTDGFQYSVEPGHSLIGNAVSLLTQVQTVKNSRGKKWAILDVGTDQLTKITLLKWPHRVLLNNGEEVPFGQDAIAGPLCFAGDTIKENIKADGLQKGTPLVITEAGAYTFSLSNKFNGRTAPKWLILKSDGAVVQTMEKESLYDELQHARFDWEKSSTVNNPDSVHLSLVENLSSQYLYQSCEKDHFRYVQVDRMNRQKYCFTVSTSSTVDFISMPFAIRIFGDAAIISVLHSKGFDKKNTSIWGRKLTMDFYEQVKSNETFDFIITLSETIQKQNQHVVIARFTSSCKKCSGSIIISYDM